MTQEPKRVWEIGRFSGLVFASFAAFGLSILVAIGGKPSVGDYGTFLAGIGLIGIAAGILWQIAPAKLAITAQHLREKQAENFPRLLREYERILSEFRHLYLDLNVVTYDAEDDTGPMVEMSQQEMEDVFRRIVRLTKECGITVGSARALAFPPAVLNYFNDLQIHSSGLYDHYAALVADGNRKFPASWVAERERLSRFLIKSPTLPVKLALRFADSLS